MIRKRLILDSQRFQILRDGLSGLYLLHGWLRMRVVISSSVYDIRFIGFRQFPNVFHCRILLFYMYFVRISRFYLNYIKYIKLMSCGQVCIL